MHLETNLVVVILTKAELKVNRPVLGTDDCIRQVTFNKLAWVGIEISHRRTQEGALATNLVRYGGWNLTSESKMSIAARSMRCCRVICSARKPASLTRRHPKHDAPMVD